MRRLFIILCISASLSAKHKLKVEAPPPSDVTEAQRSRLFQSQRDLAVAEISHAPALARFQAVRAELIETCKKLDKLLDADNAHCVDKPKQPEQPAASDWRTAPLGEAPAPASP